RSLCMKVSCKRCGGYSSDHPMDADQQILNKYSRIIPTSYLVSRCKRGINEFLQEKDAAEIRKMSGRDCPCGVPVNMHPNNYEKNLGPLLMKLFTVTPNGIKEKILNDPYNLDNCYF